MTKKGLMPTLLIMLIAVTVTGYLIYSGKINLKKLSYTCPIQGISCMPIIAPEKKYMCEKDYLTWVTANCPNFEGVSY